MAHYVFCSHDGYGLGHTRRNTIIAAALRALAPGARITVLTGVDATRSWMDVPGVRVVRFPPLLKDGSGAYRSAGLGFEAAVEARRAIFTAEIAATRPGAVVIDRHPYGVAGELREGVELARAQGAAVVLGLRDVLDDAAVVAEELAGAGWRDVPELFDEVLVYGSAAVCDQRAEYGLPAEPVYCGWVAEAAAPAARQAGLLLIAAGGGGDGADVFRLGLDLLRARPHLRAVIAAGPYADAGRLADAARLGGARVTVRRGVASTAPLYARAGAAVQMAGYNSTFEALAAGVRPIVVPRRAPRREQAIRAGRLAALGLLDVVDEGVSGAEAAWLLDQPRLLAPGALAAAGISLDGAIRAAERILAAAGRAARPAPVRFPKALGGAHQ